MINNHSHKIEYEYRYRYTNAMYNPNIVSKVFAYNELFFGEEIRCDYSGHK